MLLVVAVVTPLRALVFQHRWFIYSGAAVLQIVLHGLFGLSYLMAGAIAVGLAALATGIALFGPGHVSPSTRPNP
jgi:hypothetical protein